MWETKEWTSRTHRMIKPLLLILLLLSMLYIEQDRWLPQRWLKVLFPPKLEREDITFEVYFRDFFFNINEKNNTNENIFCDSSPEKRVKTNNYSEISS